MALIPALFLSMFFVILAVVIITITTIIGKTGMSILSSKRGIKNWGFLWLPLAGSWYDGVLISQFIKKGKKIFPGLFLVLRLIPALLYLVLLWDINFSNNVPGPEMQFSDYIMLITMAVLGIGELTIRLIKVIAMINGKCNTALSIVIGLLFPDFWSFFMLTKN